MSEVLDGERLLTPLEAARALGVSTERVRQLVVSGELPAIRTPLGKLFKASAVNALVEKRAATPPRSGRRG